jgi:hypothetical protein
MADNKLSPQQIENLRCEAKRIRKAEGIKHTDALNRVAVREGFKDWWDLQNKNPQSGG